VEVDVRLDRRVGSRVLVEPGAIGRVRQRLDDIVDALLHRLLRVVPGFPLDVSRDAGPFRPAAPLVADDALQLAVVGCEQVGWVVEVSDDGDSLRWSKRRPTQRLGRPMRGSRRQSPAIPSAAG
jgi:hypothetical protein